MDRLTLLHDDKVDRAELSDGRYILTYRFSRKISIEEYHFAEKFFGEVCHLKWWKIPFNLDVVANGFQITLPSKAFYEEHEKRITMRINGKMFLINQKVEECLERHHLSTKIINENPPLKRTGIPFNPGQFINVEEEELEDA